MANGHAEINPETLNKEGCEFGRSLKKDINNIDEGDIQNMKQDIAKIIDNLQGRPTWTITVMITVMSSMIVGMAVKLMGG